MKGEIIDVHYYTGICSLMVRASDLQRKSREERKIFKRQKKPFNFNKYKLNVKLMNNKYEEPRARTRF